MAHLKPCSKADHCSKHKYNTLVPGWWETLNICCTTCYLQWMHYNVTIAWFRLPWVHYIFLQKKIIMQKHVQWNVSIFCSLFLPADMLKRASWYVRKVDPPKFSRRSETHTRSKHLYNIYTLPETFQILTAHSANYMKLELEWKRREKTPICQWNAFTTDNDLPGVN